jgi:6-pyruvoyltetrahydropterin/6-carboxytetrahydropterin synthase
VYQLGLIREFIAQHALVGGDWGAENLPHSHAYRLEWRLAGPELDRHGYLADLLVLEAVLDGVVASVRDRHLNDLPVFQNANPSLERFARYLAEILAGKLADMPECPAIRSEVRLWEHANAWASWDVEVSPQASAQ